MWPHEVSQRILLIPASYAILLSNRCHMFLLKYYLLYIGCQCFCMIKIIPILFKFRSFAMCSFKKIEKNKRSEIFKDEKSPKEALYKIPADKLIILKNFGKFWITLTDNHCIISRNAVQNAFSSMIILG